MFGLLVTHYASRLGTLERGQRSQVQVLFWRNPSLLYFPFPFSCSSFYHSGLGHVGVVDYGLEIDLLDTHAQLIEDLPTLPTKP